MRLVRTFPVGHHASRNVAHCNGTPGGDHRAVDVFFLNNRSKAELSSDFIFLRHIPISHKIAAIPLLS